MLHHASSGPWISLFGRQLQFLAWVMFKRELKVKPWGEGNSLMRCTHIAFCHQPEEGSTAICAVAEKDGSSKWTYHLNSKGYNLARPSEVYHVSQGTHFLHGDFARKQRQCQ